MKIATKTEVPGGVYDAVFDGVKQTDHEQYGAGLQWCWTISAGRYRNQQVYRTTKTQASGRNTAGKFLVALTGLALEQAAQKDVDDYIGAQCSVIVGCGESGSSRVESFAVKADDADDHGAAGPEKF